MFIANRRSTLKYIDTGDMEPPLHPAGGWGGRAQTFDHRNWIGRDNSKKEKIGEQKVLTERFIRGKL